MSIKVNAEIFVTTFVLLYNEFNFVAIIAYYYHKTIIVIRDSESVIITKRTRTVDRSSKSHSKAIRRLQLMVCRQDSHCYALDWISTVHGTALDSTALLSARTVIIGHAASV